MVGLAVTVVCLATACGMSDAPPPPPVNVLLDDPLVSLDIPNATPEEPIGNSGAGERGPASSDTKVMRTWNVKGATTPAIEAAAHQARERGAIFHDLHCPPGAVLLGGIKAVDGRLADFLFSTNESSGTLKLYISVGTTSLAGRPLPTLERIVSESCPLALKEAAGL
jgi:hypothetical protein